MDPTPKGPRLYRIPLVPMAIALAAGVIAGRYVPLPTGLWAVAAAAGLVTAIVLFRRTHLHIAACLCALTAAAGLGAVHVRVAYFSLPENHIVTFTAPARTLATLRGRIITAPLIFEAVPSATPSYPRPPQTSFILAADRLGDEPNAAAVTGMVRVTVEEADARLAAGQQIEILCWVGRFRPPANPGEHDWAAAARDNDILVWAKAPAASAVTVLAGDRPPWHQRLLWHMQAAAMEHLGSGDDDVQSTRLLQALIVGQRHPALRKLNELMMQGGIAHYLSISGSHLAVFLSFAYLLCRLLSLSQRQSALAVLVVLGAYIALAEANAPLLRSAIMAAALCLAAISRRQYSSLNAMAAAMILLLAIDPMDLFSAGFQLSFGIVAGLVLLQEPVKRLLFGRYLRHQGLMVYRQGGRVRRWVAHTLTSWLIAGVTMSVAASIVSTPLAAYHFGLFSPYGVLLTFLLALPMTGVLVPGYVALALAPLAPNLSDAFGRLATTATAGLGWLIAQSARLPGLCIELRPVGVLWTVGCYLVLAAWLWRRRLPGGTLLAGAGAALVIAGTVWTQLPATPPPAAQLHLLSVGDGQCAVLQCPTGPVHLFDAGTRSTLDVWQEALKPFLRARSLPAPASAFISHANTDHYSAVADMVREGRLKRVYLNEYFSLDPNLAKIDSVAAAFLELLDRQRVEVIRIAAGDTVDLDPRTRVEVLWPPRGPRAGLTVNDTSLVLRVTCDGRSVIIPGDVAAVGEAALSQAPVPRADALVLPHHGGWTDSLPAFVAAVAPKFCLVSRSRDLQPPARGKDAAEPFYSRLQSQAGYRCTAHDGWIELTFGRGELSIRTSRDRKH